MLLLLQRSTFLGAVMFSIFNLRKEAVVPPVTGESRTYVAHEAPPGVDFRTNPTVFGSLLRGELPAKTFLETKNILVFEDIHPRAQLHALVIPKRFVESVYDVDGPLLQELQQAAHAVLQEQMPTAYAQKDYILCFHIPPFNSVNHLHMHVLAPASTMSFPYRYIKYKTNTRWCISLASVERRLELGLPSVPYKKPW